MSAFARGYADGDRSDIDLRALAHDQQARQGLLAPAALGWWLLGALPKVRVLLPEDPLALLPLARSGLLFALTRADVAERVDARRGRDRFSLTDLRRDGQMELGYVDWARYEGLSAAEGVRAVRDMEDPARTPPAPALANRHYTWIDNLSADAAGARGPVGLTAHEQAAWRQAVRRFNADGDQVLYELVSNVHLWAFPAATPRADRRAVAVCSVSSGSPDRLHVVVMDNGRGIPDGVTQAQRAHRRSGADWRSEVSKHAPEALRADPPAALVHLLASNAHGDRNIRRPDEGHGLFTATVKAGHHAGKFRLLTHDAGGEDPRAILFQKDRERTETDRLALTGTTGTLAYATLHLPSHAPAAERGPQRQPALADAAR